MPGHGTVGRRRRALVTGASSGIGAAVARRLAREGWEVWLAARRLEALEQGCARIRAAGGAAHALALDVADADAAARAVERLDEQCGGLDLVVANAGVNVRQPPEEISWPAVRTVLTTNLLGAAATVVPLVPRMVARGGGQLAVVSSIGAEITRPTSAAYGASKAGLTHLMLALAPSLRKRGVHVTVLHPGWVSTPLLATASYATPFRIDVDEAARHVCRAIAERRELVRFPWTAGAIARAVALLPRGWSQRLATRPRRG
jgi:short-subunit dehydrogenase